MSEDARKEVNSADYALTATAAQRIDAPDLPYPPRDPKSYRPRIALVGAGGITAAHLTPYKQAGYDVVAICDIDRARAEARSAEFFPDAMVTTDVADVLDDESIEVLDIATHPGHRVDLIERALNAGRHVLSQKPFVLDLDTGERLAKLADDKGVKLAINQNGRWAPHLAYMREAVKAGLIGDLASAHVSIHWDHTWTRGTPFEDIDDLIFYDFAIHWFDFVTSVASKRIKRVYATRAHSVDQGVRPPLFAQALVELEDGQASLVFDGAARFGPVDTTYIAGSEGTLSSTGPNLGEQRVKLVTAEGEGEPALEGTWFNDGFHGAMGELLCAIEEDRMPINNAHENLTSLALCFAAIESAHTGQPVDVGSVRQLRKA